MSSRALIAADVRNALELLAAGCGGSVGDSKGPLAHEWFIEGQKTLDAARAKCSHFQTERDRYVVMALTAFIRGDLKAVDCALGHAKNLGREIEKIQWMLFDGFDGLLAMLKEKT